MRLDNVRVGRRLWGTVLGLLSVLIAVTIVFQQGAMRALADGQAQILRIDDKVALALRWQGLTRAQVDTYLAHIATIDPALEIFFSNRIGAGARKVSEAQEQFRASLATPAEQQAFEAIEQRRDRLAATLREVPEIKATADADLIRAFATETLEPVAAGYLDALQALVAVQLTQRDAAAARAESAQLRMTVLGLAAAAFVLGIGMAMIWRLGRSITTPLDRAVTAARAIGAGDLAQVLKTGRKDEFGQLLQALDDMADRLRTVVFDVRHGVNEVAATAAGLADGNRHLARRTERTASDLARTAAGMQALTGTVSQARHAASQAAQWSGAAAQAAERGNDAVRQVADGMEQISGASREMSDVIAVVESLAFQTNILALNAATEAARAGEHGRGFAVVAAEVRMLAQRSATAAKQVKVLITASSDTVEAGTGLARQAGEAMTEIVASAQRVRGLMEQIAEVVEEQGARIDRIGQAIGSVDQMTQQNAALVDASATGTAALSDQAGNLARVVSLFRLGIAMPEALPHFDPQPATGIPDVRAQGRALCAKENGQPMPVG